MPELYKPFANKTKTKSKYFVYVKKDGKLKKIGFGMKGMQQFKDKTGIWKKLDHGDKTRQKSFLARSKGIKLKDGSLAWKNPMSPAYHSVRILW